MSDKAEQTYSFAEFEVDTAKRLLLKNAEVVSLNPKAFDLLVVLLENRGHIVTKEELLKTVWPDQFVEENNLTVHVSALRKIFGEKKGEYQFIVTVPGKGYKFVADVRSPLEGSQLEQSGQLLTLRSSVTIPAPRRFETNLIGRDREVAEVKDLLRRKDENLVTLTGAGGSGKTSLARTIAAEMTADFADGVFFVELAAATDSNLVVSAIAQTLDVTEASNKSLDKTLQDFLQPREILLVLDNFEQVLTAAPRVAELLASAASIKILVTSRAALRLPDECEISVRPLELPPVGSRPVPEQLDTYPAIALFCERAQAVKPNFVLTDENVVTVAEICRRLDGLPLAIELAAVRVRLLSPSAILERLENSLSLLTGGAADLPSRQRTMRGAVKWSYDLLTEEEKFLFRRLAVFAGGFSVEAAEFVSEGKKAGKEEREKEQREEMGVAENKLTISPSPHLQVSPPAGLHVSPLPGLPVTPSPSLPVSLSVLDLLDSLINCNLITLKDQTDGNARLRMLEVVREFALECLEESGETESVRRLHSEFFLKLVETAEPLLHGENGSEWLDKLETDYDNLRSALSWSLKNDGEIAARMAADLRFFWLNRSHLSEGLSWSEAALAATKNDVSKARSDLLLSNGVFLRSQGKLEAAQRMYERTLAESRQLNDLTHIIKANHGLAAIAVLQKDFSSAQACIEEALALSRELKDEMQTAYSLASLGDLEMSRENLSVARPLLEECLLIAKKLKNKKLLTVIWFNLGTIDFFENFFERSAANFAESLRLAQEMGNKTMVSCAIEGFAALAVKNGNAAQSARLAGAAESLRETIGYFIEPAEEIFRNSYLSETRAVLGEKRFADLYLQGKVLSSDDATALAYPDQSTIDNDFADENFTEIIVENHSFSRIAIEEVDDAFQSEPVTHAERRLSGSPNANLIASPNASEKSSRTVWIAFALFVIFTAIVVTGVYFWR